MLSLIKKTGQLTLALVCLLLSHTLLHAQQSDGYAKLLSQIDKLMYQNSDSSVVLLSAAIAESLQKKDSTSTAKLELKLGLVEHLRNNFFAERDAFLHAAEFSNSPKNSKLWLEATAYIGYAYRQAGKYDSAVLVYDQLIQKAVILKDTTSYLNAINDKGVSYQALHDYGRAAVYYYDVISKAGAVSFNDIKARAWYNLATLNQDNGNLQDALRLYSIAGNLYKTTPGKSYQLLNVYLAKGRIYSDLHLADSAEHYFKLGKTLSAILESNSSMIDALLQEAVSLRMSGKFSDAGKNIAQAYELSMKEFDRSKQADVLIEMGELAMAQKDYPGAVMHYEKSYTIASQLQNVDQCSLASKGLSKAYEGLGKIEMAYHYLNIYNNWKDSVPDVSSRVQFEQVRDLYNLELKNTEIRLLRQENEINNLKLDQRKRLLISTGFILLISFLFLFFMYRSRGKTAEVNALLDKKNREIEWQNVRLERSNKDLEQFAYITSHDLNQPLRNISSFAEILERKYGDKLDKDGLEFIQFIKGSASRMSVLLHDLLAYSKIQTQQHEFSSVDLNAVLEVVKQNLKVGIDETGTTIVLLTPLPVIDAYETLMVQLMQNLISNSIKYSKNGIPPVIIIETKVQDGNLEISFSDNGIGFDNAYAERVFSLFKRLHTSEEYEGSGIGLSICKRIMERHYGNIKVDSKEGVGTTMTLVFPASVLRSKKQQQL